jgi:ATP-dependent DNA ligase
LDPAAELGSQQIPAGRSREEELAALKRLDDLARRLEGRAASSVTSEALSVQAKGGALFTLMRARDLEGIVAKRLNDPYKAQVTWFKLMRWDAGAIPRHLMNQRRMRN